MLIVINYLSCLNPTAPFGSSIDYRLLTLTTFYEIAVYNTILASNCLLCSTISKVGTVLVRKVGECGLACVGDHSCFSFNIAIQPDNSGHFTCELLATDKYNEPTKLTASGDFNHYSFAVGL